MIRRLQAAWDLFALGHLDLGTEMLFTGRVSEPFEITTPNPLYHGKSKSELMEKLGLEFITAEYFKAGQAVEDVLNDVSQVIFSVEWRDDQPRVDVRVETQFWDMLLVLKYDAEKELFLLDEVDLEKYDVTGTSEKGFLGDRHCVQTAHNSHAREVLPQFLSVFSWAAQTIIQDDYSVSPDAFQAELEERIKPIYRILVRQRNEVAQKLEKVAVVTP